MVGASDSWRGGWVTQSGLSRLERALTPDVRYSRVIALVLLMNGKPSRTNAADQPEVITADAEGLEDPSPDGERPARRT